MNDAPDMAPYEGEVIEPATTTRAMVPHNPFERSAPAGLSAGAVTIESQRATAEVQGRMLVAKRFPRDGQAAYASAMEACQRIGLAECAIYSYQKGGKVEGPSIRLAEELARAWGNIEYGLNELSRFDGGSEMEAFAWDLETHTRSSQKFTVKHIRDRNAANGPNVALTQERDIYEITANMGARRMRARILAILPPELVDDAVTACKATIKHGGGKPLSDRIRAMTTAFGQAGVTAKMIADKVGHPLDQITPDELVSLRSDLQAIKEGAKVSEFFGAKVAAPANADPFEKAAAGAKAEAERPAAAPEPPAMTFNNASVPAWMKSLETHLAAATTREQVDAIAAHPAVLDSLSKWPGAGKAQINKLVAAAILRVDDDNGFPGEVSRDEAADA